MGRSPSPLQSLSEASIFKSGSTSKFLLQELEALQIQYKQQHVLIKTNESILIPQNKCQTFLALHIS